jgi:hypothetical protein
MLGHEREELGVIMYREHTKQKRSVERKQLVWILSKRWKDKVT